MMQYLPVINMPWEELRWMIIAGAAQEASKIAVPCIIVFSLEFSWSFSCYMLFLFASRPSLDMHPSWTVCIFNAGGRWPLFGWPSYLARKQH